MKKRWAIVLSITVIVVIIVSVFAATLQSSAQEPFYVGVTFGGDSLEEAKPLIDKVKDYTNVFVFTSYNIMKNVTIVQEIGDYAVNAGLNVIVYYANIGPDADYSHNITRLAEERWGSHFLGLYFNDEPVGRLIDNPVVVLYPAGGNGSVSRSMSVSSPGQIDAAYSYSSITNLNYTTPDDKTVVKSTGAERDNTTRVSTSFYPSGDIYVETRVFFGAEVDAPILPYNESAPPPPPPPPSFITDYTIKTWYYPNGTITSQTTYQTSATTIDDGVYTYLPDGTVLDPHGAPTTEAGSRSQFTPYETLLNSNPLKDYANTADTFVRVKEKGVESVKTNHTNLNVLTSDYALYWFDYKIGYNTVLAQFVGNESRERHVALCRGAAETLGGDWGAIITWKYNQPPYLESGDELYSDLALAYSAGAKYGIIFTHPNMTVYGTLTEQHFEALQRFWTTLHDDPDSFGSNPARAAYVVPADYGFGFRSANDKIWGLWEADEHSQKLYDDTVFLTSKYGSQLNILYDGPETATKLGGYRQVYYYNQTVT